MHIILGATGHVGSAAAKALRAAGEAVTLVTRDADKSEGLRSDGADVAVADVEDVDRLRAIFRTGRRAFLLNPPADPSQDTDAVEKRTIAAILRALDGSGLEKVVAESTYGAQPGQDCGDLNTLYELEQGLAAQSIPYVVNRAAYYFSNLDAQLPEVRGTGVLRTLFPEDLKLPMVAPADLGLAAARRLMEPVGANAIHYVEGPQAYSFADVASTLTRVLGRPVRVETAPRDQWEQTYRQLGFSERAARSYARMTAVTADGAYDLPERPERGSTTLEQYLQAVAV